MRKLRLVGVCPRSHRVASTGSTVCIQYYLVPKPMLLTISHTSRQEVWGSPSRGKSLKTSKRRTATKRISRAQRLPGPTEPTLNTGHQGHRPRDLGICCPSRHAQSGRLHAVSRERPTLRPAEGHAEQPCELAPAWPEVEILSVVLGVSMTTAGGSSGCSLLASAAASVVPSGRLGVSGPWVGLTRLPLMGLWPNCSSSTGAGWLLAGSPGSGFALCFRCPHSFVRLQVSGKIA